MQYIDLHNHTRFSFDSEITMEQTVRTAEQNNIGILGFSDHLDFAQDDPGCEYYEPDEQFRVFSQLKDESDIELFCGIEASYEDYYYDRTLDIIKRYPFDYVIMSVHFVNNTVISQWIREIEDGKNDIEAVDYSPYFKHMIELVRKTDFDILGHMDYYKKYSKFTHKKTFDRYRDYYARIIEAIVAKGSIIEINTSGLRYDCSEQFPEERILQLYSDAGGELISTGSDSHDRSHIGFGLDKAEELISKYNFKKFKPGV
ncbi:MAG: histidinol-phosphatase HisJ family protein [bacterium]